MMEETNNKRIKVLIVTGLVIVIMLFALIMVMKNLNNNKQYTGDSTLIQTEVSNSDGTVFAAYGEGFLKVRSDGAEAIDSEGKKLWNIAYSVVNPIVDVCGNCAVIADKGNKVLYITDGTGEQTGITTENAIVDVEIAKQGVTAVWTSNAAEDTIYLFDVSGMKLLEIVTGIIKEGTPIDISLSDDGQKLAVSYLTVEDTEVKNWVTLYNFGDVGQNYTDKVVGSFTYNGAMVPKVEFMNDTALCIYKDNGFVLYKMKELPELIYEETANDTIYSIVTSEKYIMMITGSAAGATRKIKIYDTSGKILTETENDVQYTKAAIFDESFALYNERDINLFYIDGSVKYVKSASGNIRLIVECNDTKEYVIVQERWAETIELNDNQAEVEY